LLPFEVVSVEFGPGRLLQLLRQSFLTLIGS
jgi:hypothetical protein